MEDDIYAEQIGRGFGATDDKENRRGVVGVLCAAERVVKPGCGEEEKTGGKSEIRGSWVFQLRRDPSSLLP